MLNPIATITFLEGAPLLNGLLLTLLFSFFGLAIMLSGFRIIDKFTPGVLGEELTVKKNVALAIVVGAMILGLSIIIAAALIG